MRSVPTSSLTLGRELSEERSCESPWKMVIMPALTVNTDITNVLFPSSTSYFDRSRCFNNQIVNSDTRIGQMPYEESDVSDTEEEQTRRVYEARQNVPKDSRYFSDTQAEVMAEPGRVSLNADEAGPSGTANVSETAELAIEEVPTHAPYQNNLCAGFGVEDILSSVTMTTPVMNVTPPRQQAEYFVPGAEAQARAATTEAQAVTPETIQWVEPYKYVFFDRSVRSHTLIKLNGVKCW
ncbi:hypothetical protein CYMTET_17200 [Cymbomonas tetramitiformis]|uniref:Uncharacterized protein n=1 Tax=Cymbomonas tetramitiformis TaxID=36881 RepID=A0AAE0L766_9CHLO|nr:hypothetical protein CYMTET_17200 [Cymbomonas tetramitiformis]